MRTFYALPVLALWSVAPGFSEITNQHLSVMLSGFAELAGRNGSGSGGFSDTFTSFGTFGDSATVVPNGIPASIAIEMQETTTVTSRSFDLDLTGSGMVSGSEFAAWVGEFELSDNYTLSFTVPAVSVLHLTSISGLFQNEGFPPRTCLINPFGDCIEIPDGSVDMSLTLPPGNYQLVNDGAYLQEWITGTWVRRIHKESCRSTLSSRRFRSPWARP